LLQTKPVQVGDASDWISLAGNGVWLIALKADGTLWKWDFNSWWINGWPMALPPTRLGIHNDWLAIGSDVSLAGDGSLWYWAEPFGNNTILAPSRRPAKIENIFDKH
jgi:hypothetical protein